METGSNNPFIDLRRYVENMARRAPAAEAHVLHQISVHHARLLNQEGQSVGRPPVFAGAKGEVRAVHPDASQFEDDEWGDQTNAPEPVYRRADPAIRRNLAAWGSAEFHRRVTGAIYE